MGNERKKLKLRKLGSFHIAIICVIIKLFRAFHNDKGVQIAKQKYVLNQNKEKIYPRLIQFSQTFFSLLVIITLTK